MPRGVCLALPLGHTAGKKHAPALKRDILLGALAAFDKALEINPNFMAAVDSRIALEAEIKATRPSFFKRLFGG